jgi:hypothetical protein
LANRGRLRAAPFQRRLIAPACRSVFERQLSRDGDRVNCREGMTTS